MAQRTKTSKGQPAGSRPQDTGIPTNVSDENMQDDERLTNDYTNNDERLAEGVRELHPNRNVDKGREDGRGNR